MKTLNIQVMRLRKGLVAIAAAFAGFSLSLAPAYAADTEVYVANGGGGSGTLSVLNPNVVLMLDNSGSMRWEVDTGLDADILKNQRLTHMKDGARALVTSARGNTRVGIGTYAYRMLTGTKTLDTVTSTNTGGSVDKVISGGDNDVAQLATDGAPDTASGSVITGQTRLDIASTKQPGPLAPTPTYYDVSPSKSLLNTNYDRVGDNMGVTGSNGNGGTPDNKNNCQIYNIKSGKKTSSYSNICQVTITVPTKDEDGVTPLDFWYVDISADNGCSGCSSATNTLYLRDGSWTGSIVSSDSGSTANLDAVKLAAGKTYHLVVGATSQGKTGKVRIKVNVVGKDTRPMLPTVVDVHQRIGLRYDGVDIPAGATITSANLYFYAAADSSSRPNVTIGVDRTLNPQPFGDAAASNLFDRPNLTFYGSGQNTAAWDDGCTSTSLASSSCLDDQKYDVSAQVQALVDQSGWCGGDMVFVLKGDDAAKLAKAYSYEGNSARAPRLVVNYALGSGVTCRSVSASTTVSTEDAHQDLTATALPDLKSTTLLLGDTKVAGMRFTNLHVYPNTADDPVTVKDAYLEFNVASNSNPGVLRFYVEQTGVSQGFSTRKNDVGLRIDPASTYLDWDVSSNPNWTAGSKIRSPSIKALVQQILDRGQALNSTLSKWEYGGTLALLVRGMTPNKSGAVYSFDAFTGSGTKESDYGGKAPRLVIQLEGKVTPDVNTHRDVLLNEIKAMTFPNNTPLISTYYELARYYAGATKQLNSSPIAAAYDSSTGKYLTPIDNGWTDGSTCQSNNLVLLTDGEPTGDDGLSLKSKIEGFTGKTCLDSSSGQFWDCAKKLADYLVNHEGPKVTTHTIGLGPDVSALQGLKDVASSGKGSYLAASDAGQLAAVFTDILNGASYQASSLAAPGVAVNQLNRFQHLSQVYYSVFKPSDKVNWAGNLKRYKLQITASGPRILDARGEPAIDVDDKFFVEGSRSYWSGVDDGPEVTLGGGASRMSNDFVNRRVFTYLGANPTATSAQAGMIAVDDANAAVFTAGVFNTADSSAANLTALRNWVRGQKADGTSRNIWGAPIHGQPVLVNYGYSGGSADAAQVDESLQLNAIFLSTNEGYLHAIDSTTGNEIFSFMPQELLRNVEALKANNSGALINGLDSSWVVWRHDENDDRQIFSVNGDWVYLFGGMRDGGRNYYSLDATAARPGAAPAPGAIKVRFVLQGGTAGTAYENMGYTWSIPSLGRIKYVTSTTDTDGNVVRVDNPIPVMIFGGGYDQGHERAGDTSGVSDSSLARSQDAMGNQLYIVNAQTGNLVWWASNDSAGAAKSAGATYKLASAMKWAIPSSIKTVDRDGDGYIDLLYFGDLGGQLWRVDINNNATSQATIVKRIKRIGSFGREESTAIADNRRFYEQPSAATFTDSDGSKYMAVSLGSGYRSRPLMLDTAERFYLLKDTEATKADLMTAASYDTESVLKAGNLADLTTATTAVTAAAALSGKKGWLIRLDNTAAEDQGEKVMSSPIIYQGSIIFTTFLPGSNKPTCGSIRGRSRYWSLDATDATATQDFNNDGVVGDGTTKPNERFKDYVGDGPVSSPQIVTDGTNAGALFGTGGSSVPPIPNNGVIRLRWYEKKN